MIQMSKKFKVYRFITSIKTDNVIALPMGFTDAKDIVMRENVRWRRFIPI